jgi:hypothetical protein
MGIASRIKRLEHAARIGICPVCDGKGKVVVTYIDEHDPVPEVQGCKTCGEVNHIVVRWVTESAIQDRYAED